MSKTLIKTILIGMVSAALYDRFGKSIVARVTGG